MLEVSPYIVAIGVAWLVAHLIKYTIAWLNGKRIDLTSQLFLSGGMPSSHAATAVAVWTVVLFKDGIETGLFGLATLVTLIICYDSVKVRRSSGEQGEALRQLIRDTKSDIELPRAAKGHTPVEVMAGAMLGVVLGAVVFLATN